jgi:hypothetical protein
MEMLKPAFLDTARHLAALGKHEGQYASLLTFTALDPGDTFTTTELAAATRTLPTDGLHDAAQALVRALEGAGDQRADYWSNRIAPYLHAIWPKTRDNVSPAIAESLGRLCVAAQDAFPEALTLLRAWLQPPAHPGLLSTLPSWGRSLQQVPRTGIGLLEFGYRGSDTMAARDLGACLDAIRTAAPELETDPRF